MFIQLQQRKPERPIPLPFLPSHHLAVSPKHSFPSQPRSYANLNLLNKSRLLISSLRCRHLLILRQALLSLLSSHSLILRIVTASSKPQKHNDLPDQHADSASSETESDADKDGKNDKGKCFLDAMRHLVHESMVAVMAVVTDAEVVVRGELDALGHVGDGRHIWDLRHARRGREFSAMVLQGLEPLETFQANVLDFLAGGVEFGGDFGGDATHDVCAFCVGCGGGWGLGGDREEFEL